MQGTQVQSLIGEQRSHMPYSMAKIKVKIPIVMYGRTEFCIYSEKLFCRPSAVESLSLMSRLPPLEGESHNSLVLWFFFFFKECCKLFWLLKCRIVKEWWMMTSWYRLLSKGNRTEDRYIILIGPKNQKHTLKMQVVHTIIQILRHTHS